MKSIV